MAWTSSPCAWSPDGKTLATAGKTSIALWDADGGKKGKPLPLFASSLAWSADGTMLAAVPAIGGVVQLWDPTAGKLVKPLDAGASVLHRFPEEVASPVAFPVR